MGAVLLHTNTVLPVPVQLVAGRTGTLVAPQRVDAAVFTTSSIYTALINICEKGVLMKRSALEDWFPLKTREQEKKLSLAKDKMRNIINPKHKQSLCFTVDLIKTGLFETLLLWRRCFCELHPVRGSKMFACKQKLNSRFDVTHVQFHGQNFSAVRGGRLCGRQ